MDEIRHIAIPLAETGLFATGEFEKQVTLWSFAEGRKLGTLSTVLDFGGSRLAILAGTTSVVAANYHRGIEAYDQNGSVLWSRKDLQHVQQLTPILSEGTLVLGVGLENRPFEILGASAGKTLSTVSNVRKIFPSSYASVVMCVTDRRSIYLAAKDRLWEKPLKSFAVIHVSFSRTQLVVSEAAGPFCCFDLQGRDVWEVHPEENRHFLRSAWNEELESWIAIDWNYQKGGSKRLVKINAGGESSVIRELGEHSELEFYSNGKHLISSEGLIIGASSGDVVRRFLPEQSPKENLKT